MRLRTVVAATALLCVPTVPLHAIGPDEVLPDRGLEARARHISSELRCLVCQNQSIDESDAPLARDLRVLVRERLQAGDGDAAVRAFVVARYGDFVLLRPPFGTHTLLLWLGPAVLLAAGAAGLVFARRERFDRAPPAMSAKEEAQLRSVLGRDPG